MVTRALEETAGVIDDDVEMLEEIEQIDVSSLEKQGGEAPVIRLVNLMLMSAIQKGASDIHIEPYEKEFRVRFRIDGILYNVMAPPMKFRDAITSRLKIMAKLDIAEKRLPQDGRIKIRFGDTEGGTKEIDFRVSCLPTLFGEKIVMRLLDKDKLMLDMTKLGFEADSLKKLENAIGKPWGMVLVTGPTGSGKTNTLYSSIAKINTSETNIMTAEDPVEFNLVGVNQVQVRENIGLNFAAALRSFLRQDPNIILVGEIRDFETAEIAVKASLTGHLVLSTLHTNDAPSTINRPYGMVLVTGPTGSGKTVSLYTCLNILNKPGINISTAEDPAEINLPGINQVNVNDKAGLTFAAALKAFLRQDPDIIMVGEIRDQETGEISIKAAQTGHMVLSTLHTNDAPTTLTRLMNMGIAPFNIASSVILITAQRLARKLCSCKKPQEIPEEALLRAGFKADDLDGTWQPFGPAGCELCKNSGYKGRVGIYQVMPISDDMERIIMKNGTAIDLADQAQREGVRDLRQSGLIKVKKGLTSLEEIEAVTNE